MRAFLAPILAPILASILVAVALVAVALAPPGAGAGEGPSGATAAAPPAVHEMRAGDTLSALSKRRYGSPHYAKVVRLYNRIDDPARLGIGARVRLPGLDAILADEGVSAVMGDEVDRILAAMARYAAVEGRLWAVREGSRRGEIILMPEDIREALLAAAGDLEAAAAGFGTPRPGVVKAPASLIGQLAKTAENLRTIASGRSDGYGYDLDMVHQRLALAMHDAILWARNGFR